MKKTNILVVDDDLVLAEGIADVLDAKRFKVSVANNGFIALDLVKKDLFNIVLMAIKMPGINGVETYRKIKGIRPEIKAILMTAYSNENLVEQAIHDGVCLVMDKPIDLDGLIALIEALAGKARVLVVDDNPDFCESIKDLLERKGFKVKTAGNHAEAILSAQKDPVDLFLIDIKLPTQNGFETYLALREIDPKAAYIMITGYIEETRDLAKKAIESGAYTCLHKPLDIAKMEECIDGALTKKNETVSKESVETDEVKTSILIVEDDEILRQILSDLLELKKGYYVGVAGTGKEALAEVEKIFFDVAVLDLSLPDMGGIELLRQFKNICPKTQCIILTGHSSEDIAGRVAGEKAFAYLIKPSSADEIMNTIERALGK
jgi:two-component system, NtrC family, response regulator HydG